jgi:hypothetical protein
MFDIFPHRWDDPDVLPLLDTWDGPVMQTVRDDPGEFTRDDMWLYEKLKTKAPI